MGNGAKSDRSQVDADRSGFSRSIHYNQSFKRGWGTLNSGVAVALRILGVALTVGEMGVALIVGENLFLKLPLCTRLSGFKK